MTLLWQARGALALCAAAAITLVATTSCSETAADPSSLVLDHVNVVDVTTGDILTDRRISIAAGRSSPSLQRARNPAGGVRQAAFSTSADT